jgi:hypothetical protein
MRAVVHALVLVLALAACTGNAPKTAPSKQGPPTATLRAQNLELFPGRPARIGFEPLGHSAEVIVTTASAGVPIEICGLDDVDAPVPARGCGSVASGVREPVSEPDLAAVELRIGGDRAVRADVLIEFPDDGRDVVVVLPALRAPEGPCGDNACNPFLELTPLHGGDFRARATWTGHEATLVLLQGRVLGRAQTATGAPYIEPARADGAPPLGIDATLQAPGEYALAFRARARGGDALTGVRLEASWP